MSWLNLSHGLAKLGDLESRHSAFLWESAYMPDKLQQFYTVFAITLTRLPDLDP